MDIVKYAMSIVAHLWFVLTGVNSAEMLLWNKTAYRIRPEYEDETGLVQGIKIIKIKTTQFIKIPKRHGMMKAFAEGKVIPAILLDALGATWRLDTEKKTAMVKMLNDRLLNQWKAKVLAGELPPTSSPQVAWFHPTANRQPESLVYISTPEVMGEYTGMDPYAQIERVNKALGPASTPTGWDIVKSSKKELRVLCVNEDQMEMVFAATGDKLSVEDGPVILKDYAAKTKPYLSDVGKILGVNAAPAFFKNLAFQVRVRGWVLIDGVKKRIIAKCNCNGGTAIVKSTCDALDVPAEVFDSIDGVWRCDNVKSKNVKSGQVVTIHVKAFEVAKTANVEPENSSSFGVQAIVGDQVKSRILHKEHATATLKLATAKIVDGKPVTEEKLARAAIFRKAVFDRDLAANLHILIGDKKEISMADFKSISTAILCNGVVGKNGQLEALYTDSWLNTLIPRWLRYLRDKVWTIQGSKYSQYIGAVRVMKYKKSIINELDELRQRHYQEKKEWIYPVLPPEHAIRQITAELWRFVNRKKDPQTSALNMQGCTFCTRDEDGVLQVLGNDLQELDLEKMEFSGMANAWSTPTSDEFGEDKDGDLLSILLSKQVHFGSHAWYFPTVPGGDKAKVSFTKPTTFEEWRKYFDYINSQYDGYAIAAKNTGMLDLETRLQCALAIVRGWVSKDGYPFNAKTQRMFNYIREELGIKVSKHGLGGKTGGALVEDPQELLRSLTYGEVEPKNWPNLFRATHKYGGVPVAYRHINRTVLNAILKAVLNAERVRADGTKIDFFLDYAFDIIRKAAKDHPKLQVPSPDRKGTALLAKQYKQLWNEKKGVLSKGCVFTSQDVINFVGERKGQGVRGLYADLSSSYQLSSDKSDKYRSLGLAYTYLLSWYPYYRGVLEPKQILREFAASKYLRFRPVKELLYKDEADLTPEELDTLRSKKWLDNGVHDDKGVFVVFEEGFLNSTKRALQEISLPDIATWLPRFYTIKDDVERIRQTDNFLMLCLIYAGSVGFGSGFNGETGKGYTKTATIMNYFKPELYVEVARMRYTMLGVKCDLLDLLPELWEAHDAYVSIGGYTEEEAEGTEEVEIG